MKEDELAVTRIEDALTSTVELIEDIYRKDSDHKILGLETGFVDLDQMTSGLQLGDLIVVAGRPSIGKTSLALNIAENVALEAKKPIVIFSMEMGVEQLVMRMMGSVCKLDQHNMRAGRNDDEDWGRLVRGLGELNSAPIDIINSLGSGWNVEGLEKLLFAREDRPALVVVDGLQSFDVTNTATAYDRNIQLGEQVRQLKKMALKLNVPVILTASLNRELESRPNKRPLLKDLRDIGMLEDIADLILFIYRDELYNPDSPDKGVAEVIIGKQRNGPVGMVSLAFRREYMRFFNLARDCY